MRVGHFVEYQVPGHRPEGILKKTWRKWFEKNIAAQGVNGEPFNTAN